MAMVMVQFLCCCYSAGGGAVGRIFAPSRQGQKDFQIRLRQQSQCRLAVPPGCPPI